MRKDKAWAKGQLEYYIKAVGDPFNSRTHAMINAYKNVEHIINQLDEPEKPVIPQFIANWIESYRKKTLVELINDAVYSSDEDSQCFRRWFHEEIGFETNYDEFLSRVWLDGYEVKKEKVYWIVMPTGHIAYRSGNGISYVDEHYKENSASEKFTESEIKAIDERYWAFAEEVTE